MRIATFATAMILSAAMLASPAKSQDLVTWGTTDYWDVLIDPGLGNGCLIQTEFTDGSVIRIGFDNEDQTGYMMAFNDVWGDILEGETYEVFYALDAAEYAGMGIGVYLADTPGAYIPFDSADFLLDLAQRQTMTIYNIYGEVMAVDLTGSYDALEAALECQEEQPKPESEGETKTEG